MEGALIRRKKSFSKADASGRRRPAFARWDSVAIFAQWSGKDGRRSRIRTYDPLIKSQLLYQLSYAPSLIGIP